MKALGLALTLIFLIGCQEDADDQRPPVAPQTVFRTPDQIDPNLVAVRTAFAFSEDPGNDLGYEVLPDPFRIHVVFEESGAPNFANRDQFRAAVNIGTTSDIAKYGGESGVLFTIYNVETGDNQLGPWASYKARSNVRTMSCDESERLGWKVFPGNRFDEVQIRVRTAAMSDHMLVYQNGHPDPSLHPSGGYFNETIQHWCGDRPEATDWMELNDS
ncbi:MAG: hypothetical protein HN816_14235 [Gammaproteobacteria bacterium]|nr:hypothetical protein [Gammaproteobacteria bacterium]